MHIYTLNTDIGTFEITNYLHHGHYDLFLEDEKLGEYADAEEAAADVAAFNTGHPEWDQLESDALDIPQSLSQWREVVPDENEEELSGANRVSDSFMFSDREA